MVEEADETQFWLEIIAECELAAKSDLAPLHKEATEIMKVMATFRKKFKK